MIGAHNMIEHLLSSPSPSNNVKLVLLFMDLAHVFFAISIKARIHQQIYCGAIKNHRTNLSCCRKICVVLN